MIFGLILYAAAISLAPLVSEEVLEPSVRNEVEHSLEIAPKDAKYSAYRFPQEGSVTARAIRLVSAQKRDGRWYDGTNEVTFAAVAELKRLAFGDGAFKVLMIGNSFSISNCRHMPKISESMGIELELASLFIGGCSLERHWRNIVAATNETYRPYRLDHYRGGKSLLTKDTYVNIPEALRARRWDVVTIQQCSHESWLPESYHPWGDRLIETIRELAPQAEIVVQETWSYTPFDWRLKEWKIDADEMYERLHEAYAGFARQHQLRVIPVGTAVQGWRRELPVKYGEVSLGGDVCGEAKITKTADGQVRVDGDVFHLNRRGEYLQSLVWMAKLLQVDVRKCAYSPDYVTDREAELMKRIATDVVR